MSLNSVVIGNFAPCVGPRTVAKAGEWLSC